MRTSHPGCKPVMASAIRSAEATLMAQPRASNPASAIVIAGHPDANLDPVAAHRVVALGRAVIRVEPELMLGVTAAGR